MISAYSVVAGTLLGLAIVSGLGTAMAADYPARSIRVVVPAAPGGITDVAARAIGERMRDTLQQSLVIDNRGGAGGLIGGKSSRTRVPTAIRSCTGTPRCSPSCPRSSARCLIK